MELRALQELVSENVEQDGAWQTPIEGLKLFRVSGPIERLPSIYPPSMCCILQGQKRAYLGGNTYTYNRDRYLCATMSLPVEAEVLQATPEEPVLGVLLDLESRTMAETLVAYEAARGHSKPASSNELAPGLVLAEVDDGFYAALSKLLELLNDSVALQVLSNSRLRELLYTIIEGQAGPMLRQAFNGARDITLIVNYMRENLSEPLSVDELARKGGMSRAVFHRRFKAATSFSPLQFIKALRLSDAAMQIAHGKAVSQAADAVGYTSASQFSREFRQQFGKSPKQWVKANAASSDIQATGV